MKRLLLAVLMMTGMQAFAQSDYDVSKDKENGATVYKGQFTFDDLEKEASFGWLDREAAAYKPDTNAVKYLRKHLAGYNIVVLMGTWCDDSQLLVPRLYKILQTTGYPMAQYTMFGLDRAKEAKYIEHKLYRVTKVPTVILLSHNTEIGRITESVHKSMEADLVKLIEADQEQKGG